MPSSNRTIERDGKGKPAESCDGRPAQVEGAGGWRISPRNDFKDKDHKPRKSCWDNSFIKFADGGVRSGTARSRDAASRD